MKELKHESCKYFGYQKCPHINDEIMEQATQEIPEYYGGKVPVLSFPTDEEVEAICNKCDMFARIY